MVFAAENGLRSDLECKNFHGRSVSQSSSRCVIHALGMPITSNTGFLFWILFCIFGEKIRNGKPGFEASVPMLCWVDTGYIEVRSADMWVWEGALHGSLL